MPRKTKLKGPVLLRPVRGVRVVCGIFVKPKTTLGNGYLGSRIDEERSKMRYLV